MVWIPRGALVAGTPPNALPRIADEEMPGEQVVIDGFFVDRFPHPNEEGAIPHTNVSRSEAATLCKEAGKRLCSELEWERACKGPENTTYVNGNRYRPEVCGMGAQPALLPTGLRYGCRSGFGVHDLHGGVWEWTRSDWGRGTTDGRATLRGGNAVAGEIAGRCANAKPRSPDAKDGTIGFRCCIGKDDPEEVSLTVHRGRKLEPKDTVDRELSRRLTALVPADALATLTTKDDFVVDRVWLWRPIGNEELVVFGGCAGLAKKPSCLLLVAREVRDDLDLLAWAGSGHWAPTVHLDGDPRDLWLFAGDDLGQFRVLVAYAWGRVTVGTKERKVPRPPRKKR